MAAGTGGEDCLTMTTTQADRIHALIEPLVTDMGYELVEVVVRTERIGLVLRIVIYQESGISIDDCATVSREVSRLLEVEDPLPGAYHLEVSSPGLDRPLRTERDFARNLGERVRVVRTDNDGGTGTTTGTIAGVNAEAVTIDTGAGHAEIPLADVKKAKLVIDF